MDTQPPIPGPILEPMRALLVSLLLCLALFASGVGTGYLFDDLGSVAPLREALEHSPDLFWDTGYTYTATTKTKVSRTAAANRYFKKLIRTQIKATFGGSTYSIMAVVLAERRNAVRER